MSTTAPRTTRRLTDAQLEEMLALTSHADSVELKLTVPDSERRSIVTGLGMDPLDAQIRRVFGFDTPDLRLNQHGVVVRARRVQGRGDVTVVIPEGAETVNPYEEDRLGVVCHSLCNRRAAVSPPTGSGWSARSAARTNDLGAVKG